jgi:predicted RecA/RadA family phage recombinase
MVTTSPSTRLIKCCPTQASKSAHSLAWQTVTQQRANPVVLSTAGVFDLPKTTANDVRTGAALYWNDTAKEVTTTATGNTKIGVAVAAKSGAGNRWVTTGARNTYFCREISSYVQHRRQIKPGIWLTVNKRAKLDPLSTCCASEEAKSWPPLRHPQMLKPYNRGRLLRPKPNNTRDTPETHQRGRA